MLVQAAVLNAQIVSERPSTPSDDNVTAHLAAFYMDEVCSSYMGVPMHPWPWKYMERAWPTVISACPLVCRYGQWW